MRCLGVSGDTLGQLQYSQNIAIVVIIVVVFLMYLLYYISSNLASGGELFCTFLPPS